MMDFSIVSTIFGGLLGGGLIGFIEFLIRRKDERQDKNSDILAAIKELAKKVEEVERKYDERSAINSRIRILQFRDELLEGRSHSHDAFQQALSDIDEYEAYCRTNPGFRNNQTASTVEHIKRSYAERLEKHDFL